MILSYILFLCLISQAVFGEQLLEKQNLQSVLKELDTVKQILKENSEKLIEIDYLKERTLELEKQNKQLNQKVERLERRCAEKTEKDVERKEKFETSVNTTNYDSIAVKPSSEINKEASYLHHQNIIKSRQTSVNSHIAFTAGVSAHDLHNLGYRQTIVFDKVITNIGNAYHQHTGIFTVPVKGAYVITLTMTVAPETVQWLDLVVDGSDINFISAGQGSAHDYASTTKQWILELETGSEVWVTRAKQTVHQDLHGNMNTIISGFLLFHT